MSGENIGLSLCEAVEIIVDNVVRDLKFDQTIKCTIVDASESDSGKYIVKDGSSRLMTAYSTEKYFKNTQVYVTIPKGDYEGTKIITGKVVTNADEPFIYNSPFDTYIDVTGNLVKQAKKYGLRTNSVTRSVSALNHQITNGLKGFTRMGVSADFAAWLFEQECVTGNYGIQLDILYTKGEHKNTSTELAEVFKSTVYLDVSDMVGNPYHFESFYHQEKVFDIADMDQIISISAKFFQDANFYDRNGKPIPHLIEGADDDLNPLLGGELQLNLFMQNLHVSLGYGEEEIGDEFAQISTSDSLTYSATASDNTKTMSLKWLRKNDMKQLYNVDSPDSLHEVRWYQYDITADTDGYGGVRWRRLGTNVMDCTFNPSTTNASEQIKAVAIYGKIEYELTSITADDLKNNYKQYYTYNATSKEYTQCSSSSTFSSTTSYYLKVGNKTAKTSNILTFSNEQEVASQATMKSLSALTLYCYDEAQDDSGTWIESHGNYFYYGDSGSLIDPAQANIRRKIVYEFTPIDGTSFNPDKVDSVVWEYPKKLEEYTLVESLTKTEYDKNPTKYYIDGPDGTHTKCTSGMTFDGNKSYYTYESFGENTMIRNFRTEENAETEKIDGYFNISSYLSSSYNNNTISLTLTYENVEYHATLDLTFGQSSLMGIGYNIDLQFADSVNALLVNGEKNIQYRARIKLYDSSGIEQSLSGLTISVNSTPTNDTNQPYGYSYDKDTGEVTFTSTGKAIGDSTKPLIIKVDVKGLSNSSANAAYTISKYFPIAFKTSSSLQYLVGPTEIKYAVDGTLTGMARQPYQLFTKGSKSISRYTGGITWTIRACHYTDENSSPSYLKSPSSSTPLVMPVSITEDGVLKPYPMWEETYDDRQTFYALKGVCTVGNMVWWQPLPISKVAHFSSVIDNWESGTIKTENGTILAPRLGAGTKDSQNRFSGVILGDWDGEISSDSKAVKRTGLYGFSAGNASFGFNEDGTAFIGKSGAGRILFDGNNSVIQSASYDAGFSGIKIDLDDASIDAADFELKAYGFALDESGNVKYKDGIPQKDTNKSIVISTRAGFEYDDKGVATGSYENATPLQIGPNFSVDWTGKLDAQSGKIGGWHIGTGDEKRLQSSSGSVYLDPGGTIYGSAIKTGNSDKAPNFHVNSSGSIGIGRKDGASGDAISSTNYNFVVDSDGKVEITGEGSISFVEDALSKESKERKKAIEQEIKDREAAVKEANDALEAAKKSLGEADTELQKLIQDKTDANAGLIAALADGQFKGGTFINNRQVSSPTLIGGLIKGAAIQVTGVTVDIDGDEINDYVSEIQFLDNSDRQHGSLKYESVSQATDKKTPNRVFLTSTNAGLKLEATGFSQYLNDEGSVVTSGSNISIEAAGTIYMMSDVSVSESNLTIHSGGSLVMTGRGGVDLGCSGHLVLGSSMYGTSDPKTLPGKKGRIYFQIKSS